MNIALDKEIQLNLLNLIQKEPGLTQRQMNQRMGVSLGKVNYCISALTSKGMIKVERFRKNKKKSAYMYRLTPKGMEEVAKLTFSFLQIKIQEYNRIKKEIKLLSKEVESMDPAFREKLREIS